MPLETVDNRDYQRRKQLENLMKRKRKNPGDVQRKSASKRTKEKLKNIAKWKSKPSEPFGGTKASPTDSDEGFNWKDLLPKRKTDPRYLLKKNWKNIVTSGLGVAIDLLLKLPRKSGAGYSGSDGYEK